MQMQETVEHELIGLLRGAFDDTAHIVIPIFSEDALVVGRTVNCDLHIKHITVSPIHATIYVIRQQHEGRNIPYIRDDSENGTFINNRPIDYGRSAILFPGCVVSFALDSFSFYFIPAVDPSVPSNLLKSVERIQVNATREISIFTTPLALGGEGVVYLAIPNDESGYQMVCKVRKSKIPLCGAGPDRHCRHELHMLQKLHHPNVTKLLHHKKTEQGEYYFFTPLSGSADLAAALRQLNAESANMPLDRVKNIFLQLVKAVHYLHSFSATDDSGNTYKRPIIHRDIKPDNILLHTRSFYPRVVLTDFGSAVYEDEIATAAEGGTYLYLAPEMSKDNVSARGTPADIWSLGLVLYEMITGKLPCPEISQSRKTTENVDTENMPFDEQIWETTDGKEAAKLVRRMLTKNPAARPTSADLLRSDWIYSGTHNLERGCEFKKQFENEIAVWEGRAGKLYPTNGSKRTKIEASIKDRERPVRVDMRYPVSYSKAKEITGYQILPGVYEDGTPMPTAHGWIPPSE